VPTVLDLHWRQFRKMPNARAFQGELRGGGAVVMGLHNGLNEAVGPYALPVSSILWAVLGVFAMLLDSSGPATGHDRSQLALSVLMVAFGAWAFRRHGGAEVTAAGIYYLSAAIFVGFAGLRWWSRTTVVDDATYLATTTGYWTTPAWTRPSGRGSRRCRRGGGRSLA